MGGDERIDELDHERARPSDSDRTAIEHAAQRLATDQLHRHVVQAIDLADIVDADDRAVIDRRRGARLDRVALGWRVQDLDRERALETRVPGAVHRTHPSGADLCVDAIRTERRAGERIPRTVAAPHRRGEQRTARRATREVRLGFGCLGERAARQREDGVLGQALVRGGDHDRVVPRQWACSQARSGCHASAGAALANSASP